MKIQAIIITTFVSCFVAQASLIINEGESFTWNFDSEDFIFDRIDSEPLHHFYSYWTLSIGNINSDEIISVTLYEDSLSETPFYQSFTTNSGLLGVGYQGARNTSDMKWSDKQGIIKIDAIKGSIGFESASATTIIGGEYFTASIPEPNSVALLVIGGGVMYHLRRKRFPTRKWSLLGQRRSVRSKSDSQAAHF